MAKKQDHLAGSTTLHTLSPTEQKAELEKSAKPRRQAKMGEIFYSGGVAQALSSGRIGDPKCLLTMEQPVSRGKEEVVNGHLQRSPNVKKSILGKTRGIYGR